MLGIPGWAGRPGSSGNSYGDAYGVPGSVSGCSYGGAGGLPESILKNTFVEPHLPLDPWDAQRAPTSAGARLPRVGGFPRTAYSVMAMHPGRHHEMMWPDRSIRRRTVAPRIDLPAGGDPPNQGFGAAVLDLQAIRQYLFGH